MTKKRQVQLNCFSPLVMITTFIIETCAALYLLFKYRTDAAAQVIIMLLGSLAFFQLAEYMVCESSLLLSSLDWARLGFVAITLLPPLGIHLGTIIAGRKESRLIMSAYGSAAIFSAFFLFVGPGIQGQQCLGNYVLVTLAPYAIVPYNMYYFGWIVTGIHLAWKVRHHIQNLGHKKALNWLIIGYLSFLVPTTIVVSMNPETLSGIPSIMCGFALLLALCLLFKVAPLILKERD